MVEPCVLVLSDYAGGGGAATGGAGHIVTDSFAALKARGVATELVTGFGEPDVPATRLGGHDLREDGTAGALHAIWNGQAWRTLADVLARHDPACTVVILHQWTRYLSPASVALLQRFPQMIYLHDHFWACPNGAYFHFPDEEECDRRPLGLRCLATQCDRAGRLTKLGRIARHVALEGARWGGRHRRVLLHLSDRNRRLIGALLPHEHHETICNPLTLEAVPSSRPQAQFDVGYIGRLEPEKGVGILLDTLRANRWSGLFVGEGSLAARAASMPGVTWRGWQPREAIAAAMRCCRVIVLPSRWPETWGLVVPEAMAAGVPVLVSRRAGAAELVERFGGGSIFDPDRPDDLAASLARLLADPPAPLDEAWPMFRQYLSPKRHADRLVLLARHLWGIELAASTTGASSSVSVAPACRQV